MPYRTKRTCPAQYGVHLLMLRQEAGRCWTDLLAVHQQARAQRHWLSVRALEQLTASEGPAGSYALHSQTLLALTQKLVAGLAADLAADLAMATALRQEEGTEGQEAITTQYPYRK